MIRPFLFIDKQKQKLSIHELVVDGFFYRSENKIRITRELEYLFFLSRLAQFFSPKFNIRLYDKNSESDSFFIPPPKSEYFFSIIGNQNIFLEKKT